MGAAAAVVVKELLEERVNEKSTTTRTLRMTTLAEELERDVS